MESQKLTVFEFLGNVLVIRNSLHLKMNFYSSRIDCLSKKIINLSDCYIVPIFYWNEFYINDDDIFKMQYRVNALLESVNIDYMRLHSERSIFIQGRF